MNTPQQRDLTLSTAHLVHNAIGRGEEIKQLHAQLCQSPRPLVVTGVGGLGKTTFAQMYWQQHRAEYGYAAWLSCAAFYTAEAAQREMNFGTFLGAFLDNTALRTSLNLQFAALHPRERFEEVVAALTKLGAGPHLLVIDNAPETAAAFLPELSALTHWRILLTSREAIQNMAKFELDALPPDQAAELFERVYEAPARSEALDSLLGDIGYHTLTIEVLAAYAREKHLDPPGLLALLRQKGLMQLDDYDVSVPRYHQSRDIAAHLRDLFLLELNEEETEILRNCCILPTSNVPLDSALASEDFFCELLGKKDSEKDFKKCLRRLARLHWLVEKNGGYRCHPVIAETAKAQLQPDSQNCGVLIKNVTRLLVPDKQSNEPQIKRAPFGPLAEAVLKGVWKEEGDFVEEDEKLALLASWLDKLFSSSGEVYKALDYSQKAVAIWEKVLSSEHPDLASSYNNLALTYGALGEHQKALEYNQKDLSICEKVLPPEHPDLAQSYNSLAGTYGDLGEHQKSLEFHQKALSIREKSLPPEHPDLAQSYNNLAATYGALGGHQKSLEYNQKALAIREKVLPPEHPDLALSYNNLAATYGALGEHQKDLEYSLKALSIREKVLPPEHPDLATSYNNLAWTYQALGDLGQSVGYMRRAVAIWEKSLPAAHPHVAMAKKSLASLEEQLGR
ncbi:MAG: tetratricopeptide repeat protein [Saprospiraceae bacterium]